MSELPPARGRVAMALVAAIAGAGVAGALVSRVVFPPPSSSAERATRPIVQIVRQQATLDLSDVVDRLCPSLATIVPAGADPQIAQHSAPAFIISADGWLVASANTLPQGQTEAIFGDGQRAALSEIREDPVSGLALVKADVQDDAPVQFGDQAWSTVGQFGFTLGTPRGNGCSAHSAMVQSDFLADGGNPPAGYFRIEASPDWWTAGLPFLATDGRLLGVAADQPIGAVIPSPVAAIIVDELIRNDIAPSTNFGFRAIDYGGTYAARLGRRRSGVGVALVQPQSSTARAGLQAGDVVTAVDDEPVSSASELNRALDAQSRSAILSVVRGAATLKIAVRRTGQR